MTVQIKLQKIRDYIEDTGMCPECGAFEGENDHTTHCQLGEVLKAQAAEKIYVYVAGPLNGSGRQAQNVRRAVDMAEGLLRYGYIPFVPHLYAAQWAFLCPEKESTEWLRLDFAWLVRCDVMVRLSGKSEGTEAEEKFAKQQGIPIIYQKSIDELPMYIIQRIKGALRSSGKALA